MNSLAQPQEISIVGESGVQFLVIDDRRIKISMSDSLKLRNADGDELDRMIALLTGNGQEDWSAIPDEDLADWQAGTMSGIPCW